MIIKTPFAAKKQILALGADSEGVFSFYKNGEIFISENFGDLGDENNFSNYKKEIKKTLFNLKPDFILADLHPLYNSTLFGSELKEKFSAPVIGIQHHIAHIFSAYGEHIIGEKRAAPEINFIGAACDGTGYGLDGKIWGGEVFKIKSQKSKVKIIRIGHLENQTLIGGSLAVKEPARMLISILAKFLEKEKIYRYIKKHYSKNQFELLYSQLRQNFNCQETSSTARVLDAVSILLGFCKNQRNFKHEAVFFLEKNSGIPFSDLRPRIYTDKNGIYLLSTSALFKYLIKNIRENKKRLAATGQLYIAEGIWKILEKTGDSGKTPIFFSGGMSNNKIFSSYLEKKRVITNKIIPRGDAGLSFGQIIYYLF